MSVKHGLLALLIAEPKYGYQLRSELETQTSSAWPLNVGQIYTTLSRLERDGLVEPAGDSDDGHAVYRITAAGREELADWFSTPVSRMPPPRDELVIKLAVGVSVPSVDVREVVQRQRNSTIGALQAYNRHKRKLEGGLASELVLDSLIFQAEAEVRWLDHCEASLAAWRDTATAQTTDNGSSTPGAADEPSTTSSGSPGATHTLRRAR